MRGGGVGACGETDPDCWGENRLMDAADGKRGGVGGWGGDLCKRLGRIFIKVELRSGA